MNKRFFVTAAAGLVAASPAIAASNLDARLDAALDQARNAANASTISSTAPVDQGLPLDEMSVLVNDNYADDEAFAGMY
jgi:hypothetical protein